MIDVLYLAWRYVAYHKVKTIILVSSITLIVFLPAGLEVIVDQSSRELSARAQATPVLVGSKGSPLELVLNSVYFSTDVPEVIPYSEKARVSDSGLALAIPLHVRFRVGRHPIVGTGLDYLEFRGLRLERGRAFGMLGECVLGARAAESLGVGVGGSVLSTPVTLFDLAGVYPLKMQVVGIAEPSDTPDDDAVFVDVKTAWVIEGLAHGHQDMSLPEASTGVLKREGNLIITNASVVEYNEITPENVDSFHFHGDPATFPLTAVIAVPHSDKTRVLLQGRYVGDDERAQIVRPVEVIDELLQTILTVQRYVIAAVVVVGLSTLATAALVFLLSVRLRRRELETMQRIGGSRARIAAIVASEVLVVLLLACGLAAVLTFAMEIYGADLVRYVVT